MALRNDLNMGLPYVKDAIIDPAIGCDVPRWDSSTARVLRQVFAAAKRMPRAIVFNDQKAQGSFEQWALLKRGPLSGALIQDALFIVALGERFSQLHTSAGLIPKACSMNNALLSQCIPTDLGSTSVSLRGSVLSWKKAFCVAINQGQRVTYWRRAYGVDAVFEG